MARVLITGASGFAGSWLARACAEAGDDVIGVARSADSARPDSYELVALDLRDADGVRRLLRTRAPEVVYHLAALSSVGQSWERPAETMRENVESAVTVLEALRLDAPDARTVWVSTCEVYGDMALDDPGSFDEQSPYRPRSPYSASKAGSDLAVRAYAETGADFVSSGAITHSARAMDISFRLELA